MSTAPEVNFIIGGAQKSGTSALAAYLSSHPLIQLPLKKEAHVFDAVDFNDEWSQAEVDQRFDRYYSREVRDGERRGDATPITMFHQTLIDRVARYNPGMKWVVILRDPVDRAISHFFMERGRGRERLPLLLAVLAEQYRLRNHSADLSQDSPLRHFSYAARGRYCEQLAMLFGSFPRGQVLLLRSRDLSSNPSIVVRRALEFLGLAPTGADVTYAPVFEGGYTYPPAWSPGHALLRWRLRGQKAALRRIHGIDLDAQ